MNSEFTTLISKLDVPILLAEEYYHNNIPIIIGITGPPGVGKTTTANALHRTLMKTINDVYVISLEDFYYTKEKRHELGIKWRALPGSHDIVSIINLLKNVKDGIIIESIPRYSMVTDTPLQKQIIGKNIRCLIIEGWILNTSIELYDDIKNYLDYLIYLDAEISSCKKWRFQREAIYREQNKAGFSETQMYEFWKTALFPGIINWVEPQKDKADLVIKYDEKHIII